ncbi:MAG TPA: glycerol-3-phosphate acyltransferase [Anaerolineales bacterium]|nr:glycerol-3-phosphate acyltransferase [Anaerolineales bacterium]HRK89870.1 glycerol-3-phosphate acyltransferase [Anaerolineales bacterium]
MIALLWFMFAFFLGSLPLSVWVTQWMTGNDPRAVGDHNPGATNALKAGGKAAGLVALMLDVTKAALPIGLAYQIFHLQGWQMVLIALAPTLGHAYSPFLHFKGGKALATILGVWIGLTTWGVPLVALAGITFWYLTIKHSGWSAVLTMIGMAVYIYIAHPLPIFFWVIGLQFILVIWKHRRELAARR